MPLQQTDKNSRLMLTLALGLISLAAAVFWFIVTHFTQVPPLGPIAH